MLASEEQELLPGKLRPGYVLDLVDGTRMATGSSNFKRLCGVNQHL